MTMITLLRAKRAIGESVSSTTHDAMLTSWIEGVAERIEAMTNKRWLSTQITHRFTGNGLQMYQMPSEARSIVSLEWQEHPPFGAWQTINATEYSFDDHDGTILYEARFLTTAQYAVLYTVGYGYDVNSHSDVPEALQQIAEEMVVALWLDSRHGGNRAGLQSKSETLAGGTATTTYKDSMPRWIERLDYFRKKVV